MTLIAVTKFFPATDAARLLALGVGDLGESRDQDARGKAAELPAARWHFVGRLQTNKARSVASYAHMVHSVDRPDLAAALATAIARAERPPLRVLVQVSLDDDTARGGARTDDVASLAADIATRPELQLAGVMAIAPIDADPAVAFTRLAGLATDLRRDHPAATVISAGMSGDLEAAVAAGATHVRVGTALLGPRPVVVR